MRRSVALQMALKEATEKYVEYLRYTDKELPSLVEIFPKAGCDPAEIVKFHTQLCDTMARNGYAFKGIKVIAPNHDAARVLRAQAPLCVPFFENLFGDDTFASKQCRPQYVEGGVCFTMSGEKDSDGVPKCAGFAPALEVTGTRFPFYPPSLTGLVCDLCSVIGVAAGKTTPLTKERAALLPTYGLVLVKDGDPVETGSGRLFLDDPLKAVSLAAGYACELGITLDQKHVVLCGGLTPRTPSQSGKYTLQWGAFGSVECTVV